MSRPAHPVAAASSLCCLLVPLVLLLAISLASASPEAYSSSAFNKICTYSGSNISKSLFEDGIDASLVFIMPLETSSAVVTQYPRPWHACYGPGEQMNINQIRNGKKLPCFYHTNQWGNYEYHEENACDTLLRSNCYCYAVGRSEGSYCDPGLGGTGRPLQMPITNCSGAVAGVQADGGVPVDRATVYSKAPSGHYIALAVKPAAEQDTGDFHFWRRDADGTWSYKAGDTLTRNTFRNGSAITDVEAPEALGGYTHFCGYFEVWPERHKLQGNGYFYSNLPARFKLWSDMGVNSWVTPLPAITPEWLASYRSYYLDCGWEDPLPSWAAAQERGAAWPAPGQLRRPPHYYSVRPFDAAMVPESQL